MARLLVHTYTHTHSQSGIWHNQRQRRYTIGWPVRLGRHTHLCVIVFPLPFSRANTKSMNRFELNFVWNCWNCVYHRIMIDIHNAVFSVVYLIFWFFVLIFVAAIGTFSVISEMIAKKWSSYTMYWAYGLRTQIIIFTSTHTQHTHTAKPISFLFVCRFFGRFDSLLPFFFLLSFGLIPFFPLNID